MKKSGGRGKQGHKLLGLPVASHFILTTTCDVRAIVPISQMPDLRPNALLEPGPGRVGLPRAAGGCGVPALSVSQRQVCGGRWPGHTEQAARAAVSGLALRGRAR